MNDAELSLWQYREIASDWRPFSMTNFVIPDFLQREIEYRGKGGKRGRRRHYLGQSVTLPFVLSLYIFCRLVMFWFLSIS